MPGLAAVLLAWPVLLPPHFAAELEAAERFRAGREAVARRAAPDLRSALEHFGRAIELEPGHAAAWAGLAEARALLADYPGAEAAARRALELDGALAPANAVLGFVRLHADWNWEGAARALDRAVGLDPGAALAHHWRAISLETAARHDEAVAAARTARELEPTIEAYALGVGYRLFWARRYDEAIAELESVLGRDPGSVSAHYFLGRCHAEAGRFAEAAAALEEAARLAPRDLNVAAARAYLAARSGRRREAQRALAELRDSSARGLPLATHVASLHAALGDPAAALRWLRTAHERREGPLAWLRVDPRFDSLRDRPGFRALLAEMGLRQ